MSALTRRQLLKSGLAASAASLVSAAPSAVAGEPTVVSGEGASSAASQSPVVPIATARERLFLDPDWKFALGNADDPSKDFGWGKAATMSTFAKSGNIEQATAKLDVSSWSAVNLPHDWAVDLPFVGIDHMENHGGHPLGREFPDSSIGWYRKSFQLNTADKGKRIQIEFEGVYGNCIVFLNGHYIFNNFSGYAPFVLDVTDWVNLEQPNLLTVRVDATFGSGWFYEGAGIYRHVWLIKTDPVHLVEWGTYVRSEFDGKMAKVSLGSEVRNDSGDPRPVSVIWHLSDSTDATVGIARSQAATIPAWSAHTFEGQASVRNPKLWSLESPTLYRASATVHFGETAFDSDQTTFGIRSARFGPDKGFFLNDKPVKIYGTCCHQDHAGLGVALPDRMQYFRVERLKSMNSNGIRTSHNPPTPALMDAADTLGMLVMCETRMMDSNEEGLGQLERMIRKHRNHPSIILWSLGNEEPEQGTERGAKIIATMLRLAHQLDPTRACTVAMNSGWGSRVSQEVDVQGFNYHYENMDSFHQSFPKKPCVGSEVSAVRGTRGVYENDKVNGYVMDYDYPKSFSNRPPTTVHAWLAEYDKRPWLSGFFLWTGFDYGGEPKPYVWPNIISTSGALDYCGFAKDISYYYKSCWSVDPVLHLFPHWNWPESRLGQPIDVWCYTNLEAVELFVNGKSQGEQKVAFHTHVEWKVPYAPGAIEVRGSKGGKVVMTEKRETVGAPAKIVLRPDRATINADGEDVAVVTVEVQDAQGRFMPIADNEIAFQIAGPGKLIAVGNGCPSSHEPNKGPSRKAFMGLAQAVVQSLPRQGAITVQASSAGLEPATVTIQTNAVTPRPAA